MLFRRSLDDRRAAMARKAPPGPLRDYLSVPFGDPRRDWERGRYLALDLELTGLDPRTAEILSVGSIPIDGRDIIHAGATHVLAAPHGEVGQSASIHGLTDDEVAAGLPLEDVIPGVLEALAGRVLVAHHARVELGFLSQACERLYGAPLLARTIDTMLLQRRVLRINSDAEVRAGVLRLQAARDHFGLPRYRSHHALTDAIASGELFLAQAAHLGGRTGISIKGLSQGSLSH